jgi:hypothetical protein
VQAHGIEAPTIGQPPFVPPDEHPASPATASTTNIAAATLMFPSTTARPRILDEGRAQRKRAAGRDAESGGGKPETRLWRARRLSTT